MTVDVRLVREQLRGAQAQQSELLEARAAVQTALEEMLSRTATVGPRSQFDAGAARRMRGELAGFDAHLINIDQRMATLSRLLPWADQIAEGRVACSQQLESLKTANGGFRRLPRRTCWRSTRRNRRRVCFLAARDSATRKSASPIWLAAVGLEREVAVPALLEIGRVDPPLQKMVLLQARFIGDAALGAADGQVVKELRAAALEAGRAA